ncbi:MAG: FAD-dependent monooxygenase [Gammaproteobacteria bacterium]
MTSPEVTIIGAGIGGLTAALTLQHRGIVVRIYEQSSQLGEIGAGLNLSPNGMKVLYQLDLNSEIEAIRFQPQSISLRHFETGKAFFENPLTDSFIERFGAPFYAFHRADLHKMLLNAVERNDPNCINVGMRLLTLAEDEDGVNLSFEDGSEKREELVVGADGVHSAVRTLLHSDPSARYTGHVAYRGMVSVGDLEPRLVEPKMNLWAGPSAHVVAYYVRRGELLNYVALSEEDGWETENWTTPASKAELADRFKGWNPTVQTLIDHTQEGQCYKWALLVRDPLPVWSSKRTTLLGDAAHPMVPYLAQGSVMAMEDAWVLAHCIATQSDVTQALQTYEEARLDRTAKIQHAAWEQGQMTHAVGRGGDMSERGDGGGFADNSWIYGYDPCALFPA